MTNPWLKHVKQYHAKHPSLTYKEALQKSKSTYHPMQIGGARTAPEKRSTAANLNDILQGVRPADPSGTHLTENLINTSRLLNAFPESEHRTGTFANTTFNPQYAYTGDLVAPSKRTTDRSGEPRFQPTTGWRQFLPSKPTRILTIPTQYPHGIDLNNLRTLDVRSERKK